MMRSSLSTGGGASFLDVIGVHPASAAGVVAVDSMLFGATAATLGAGWVASIPVGAVLGIAVTLIQHRGSPQDDLGLAAGKGLIIAILTAIPTPLPSALVAGAGTAGAVTMLRDWYYYSQSHYSPTGYRVIAVALLRGPLTSRPATARQFSSGVIGRVMADERLVPSPEPKRITIPLHAGIVWCSQ